MKRLIPILLFSVFVLSFTSSCNDNKKEEPHAAHTEEYTCPMHPEIIRNAPGSCPICGMDLVKKETGSAAVAGVELETLLRPSNAYVVSSVPVTVMEQREEDVELNVVGTVAYDNRQSGAISSRVPGRIEKLYIRYRFQPVKRGQRVMDIYSPEMVTAQQNLLFLLKNDPGNSSLISAAKDRLLLLGMSAAQVQQVTRSKRSQYSVPVFSAYSGFVTDLAGSAPAGGGSDGMSAGAVSNQSSPNQPMQTREGMYVQSGQAVFTVYNPKRAWILLDVFPELQTALRVGDAVRIVPETAPQQNFRATISYIEPIFRNGSKTVSARVYFNNASMQLPIGSRVRATVFSSPKIASWLPKEAVLSLGREKIVFKKEGEGFRAHRITAGIEVNQLVQVTGGLQPTDSVARNAQYLVDNEAFIKAAGQ